MKLTTTILSVLALSSALVIAQEPGRRDGERPRPPGPRDGERRERPEGRDGERRPPGPFMRGQDPMMQNLFPPPMVMQAGEEIGLTEDQRNAMRTEMEKSRDQFEPAQQKLREQMEILGNLLKEPRVNEAQVTAQLGQVLAAENEIKKMQIAQLVRIKNLLTPEQQEKLRNYMKDHRPPMPPEGQRGERPPFGREREGERGGERRRPPPPQNE